MDGVTNDKETAEVMDCLLSMSRVQADQVGELQFWQNCDSVYQGGEQIIWKLESDGTASHQVEVDKSVAYVVSDDKHETHDVLAQIDGVVLIPNLPQHSNQYPDYRILKAASFEEKNAGVDQELNSSKTDSSFSETIDVEIEDLEEVSEVSTESKFVNGFGRDQNRHIQAKSSPAKKKKLKKTRRNTKQPSGDKIKGKSISKEMGSAQKQKSEILKDHELTKLEDNWQQVEERFRLGCDCSSNCFDGLNAEKVFRHRLNIADLTKAEHDMYLMGVILASVHPDETSRKKERSRMRTTYSYHGKKVCLMAFLYLEHVTLYQLKRIRKHLQHHGVSPRIHGNHGRKPFNTLSLDIYQLATNFVQEYIKQNHVKTASTKSDSGKTIVSYRLPPDCTKKTLHNEYKRYCQKSMPSAKIMQYSTFTNFFKKQFPKVKFQKSSDKSSDKRFEEPTEVGKDEKVFKTRNRCKSKVSSNSSPGKAVVEPELVAETEPLQIVTSQDPVEIITSRTKSPFVIFETHFLQSDSYLLEARQISYE